MRKKQIVVIGLGKFGASVAKTLYSLDNDVLAIDTDEEVVQEISDYVTHAVQADATDETVVKSLGIRNFDIAVVTIGANIQSSIMATLLLKEYGVKHIISKASSELHAKVLYKIGADRVVLPEKDMGIRVAHNITSSNILDFIELSQDYSIMEVIVPDDWIGKSIKELNVRVKYGINIMAIKSSDGVNINISPTAEDTFKKGEILVAIGSHDYVNYFEIK